MRLSEELGIPQTNVVEVALRACDRDAYEQLNEPSIVSPVRRERDRSSPLAGYPYRLSPGAFRILDRGAIKSDSSTSELVLSH